MRKVIIIILLALSSAAMAQNSPWTDTVKFIRGGKLYRLIVGSYTLTLNGVTYSQWVQYQGKIRPGLRGNWINYPGIRYMIPGGNAYPNHDGPVWWRHSDSTLVMPNPNTAIQSPVIFIGVDTNSGWRITGTNKALQFQYKTVSGWETKKSMDSTGTLMDTPR